MRHKICWVGNERLEEPKEYIKMVEDILKELKEYIKMLEDILKELLKNIRKELLKVTLEKRVEQK